MLRTLIVCLVSVLTSGAFAQPADVVVVNANVWTGDPARPAASSFAVRAGRFVAVDDGVDALIGAHTSIIDAGGARVLPGLIDAHVHLGGAAQVARAVDLRPATSRDDLLARLREWADQKAPDAWVFGTRWSAESWDDQTPPTAEEIDRAVAGRPAVLVRMDGHSNLASSAALALAGIDARGPADPPGGRIGRRADGAPTGELFEEAMGLVYTHAPRASDAVMQGLLERVMTHAASLGVTRVGSIDSRRVIERQLTPLAQSGLMPIHVAASVRRTGDNDMTRWRETLAWASPRRTLAGRLSIIGFKGYMDGSLGSRTAWMNAPFYDNPAHLHEENAGFPLALAADGSLKELVLEGAALGLQPIVHAIGDRANGTLLAWFEAIPEEQRRAVRPAVEHAQHLSLEDIPRFAGLGVIASMQPLHKADDGRYAQDRLGPSRVKTSYAFRDLIDSGALVALGSDWPVVDVNPFLGIWAAVASETTEGEAFLPEQAISVEEALVGYTRSAAYKLFAEDEAGAIEVGKSADFIVLDRDVLSASAEEIKGTRVVLTVVGGVVVHEAR